VGASGVAYADGGPAAVYNDFAQDGILSCNHPRADLLAVLRSGSLNEYGDPLTLARLKLAVRKQLAGGCRHTNAPRQGGTAGSRVAGRSASSQAQKPESKSSPRRPGRRTSNSASPRQAARKQVASSGASNASFFAGRGLIIGLLVAALALGGWLTKHALAARD
jgi:cobalamin biosynthesis Mg chelatase CobN